MSLRRLIPALALLLVTAFCDAWAQDPADLDLDTNINTPVLASRRKADAAEHARRTAASLRSAGMRASTIRGGEVVLATLPCDTLFPANSPEPKREALHRLRALKSIVESTDRYKILVAVHADDTGDDAYSDRLTEARANAVDDLLWQLAGRDDTNVIIYGLGKDEPLNNNLSRADRRANRRVEFYIVPL